jgi:tRNA dimethylallyltransferase
VTRPRLVAIVGATATGKTALAIELARRFDGEIVSADSRQIYRGMDIGTAKPTAAERASARHWLIDVVDPDEAFTLASFLDLARAALDDIWRRGTRSVVVGGTGQYVWALLEGWRVPSVPPDAPLRAELEQLATTDGASALLDVLRRIDPESATTIDPRNVRRVIRAIEVTRATGRPFSLGRAKEQPPFDATIVGLRLDRDRLYACIDARVDAMIEQGFVDEVRRLNSAGLGCELASMASIGYREICAYLHDELTLGAAINRIKTQTHRLARMQNTWFRADDTRIQWLDAEASDLIERAVGIAMAASKSGA